MISTGANSPAESVEGGVFGFGLFQDGDVGVGVFPESEEILVGFAGGFGVLGEHFGASQLKVGQSSHRKIKDDARMVKDFLELGSCGGPILQLEIGKTTYIDRVKRQDSC